MLHQICLLHILSATGEAYHVESFCMDLSQNVCNSLENKRTVPTLEFWEDIMFPSFGWETI